LQIYKNIFTFFIAFTISLNIWGIDFPSMPSVSGPSMPEIGSKPYGPWNNQTLNTKSNQQNYESIEENQVKDSTAGIALSAQDISKMDGLSALGSLTGTNEIASYLSTLSELSGKNPELTNSLNAIAGKQTKDILKEDSNSKILSEILKQLQLISEKTEQNTTPNISDNDEINTSKILRFRVNGKDLYESCKTVYFSEPEANGLFLLTGDRIFFVDNEKHSETFYMLFKPKTSDKGIFYYDVETELMQDVFTEASNLYPFSQSHPLEARRTGNLVSLRYSSSNWNLDMLLDLQKTEE